MKSPIKRILYDIVGFALIIASPIIGAVPGPGGVIVFLTGLAILAVHNKWAENLLGYAKKNADSLLEVIFPTDKPKIMLIHDLIALAAYVLVFVFYIFLEPPFQIILSVMALSVGTFWFLYNRRRYKVILRIK